MKVYWAMPDGLKAHYHQEIKSYNDSLLRGDFSVKWRHLERAHIVGQPWAVEHTEVHWEMLKFGFRIKNSREIIGQIPWLLVGGVKSFVGKIPVGNTGGANVPPLQPMQIPEDIKEMMKQYVKL